MSYYIPQITPVLHPLARSLLPTPTTLSVTYNTFVPFQTFPFLSYFILAHLHSLNGLTDFHA